MGNWGRSNFSSLVYITFWNITLNPQIITDYAKIILQCNRLPSDVAPPPNNLSKFATQKISSKFSRRPVVFAAKLTALGRLRISPCTHARVLENVTGTAGVWTSLPQSRNVGRAAQACWLHRISLPTQIVKKNHNKKMSLT